MKGKKRIKEKFHRSKRNLKDDRAKTEAVGLRAFLIPGIRKDSQAPACRPWFFSGHSTLGCELPVFSSLTEVDLNNYRARRPHCSLPRDAPISAIWLAGSSLINCLCESFKPFSE